MPKTITDQHEFSISIIQHGNADIVNFVAPSEVEAGVEFVIEYDVTNTGGVEDALYGEIKLADETILPGSEWEEAVAAGATVHKTVTIPGITEPMMGNILYVGHM